MTVRSIALAAAFVFTVASLGANSAQAQEPMQRRADDAVHLFDSLRESNPQSPSVQSPSVQSPSVQRKSAPPTVSELRLARGQYQAQQRLARLARNAWNGYQPLRPSWNSNPAMASQYPARNTIYVPIIVRSR